MKQYPMTLKTHCEGSLTMQWHSIDNEADLLIRLRYIRDFRVYNFEHKRLALNWWLIRCEDDVVLAQSKGYRP